MAAGAEPIDETTTAHGFQARRDEFDRCELIDGRIEPMAPTGLSHSRVEMRLSRLLDEWIEERGDGFGGSGEVGYVIDEHTVRAADIAVHLTTPEAEEGFATTPPDLVVEVTSPRDTWPAMERKAADWFRGGVREIWIVDPSVEVVVVHRADGSGRRLSGDDVLESDLLPGFSADLGRVFGR